MTSDAIAENQTRSFPVAGLATWKAHLAVLAAVVVALGAVSFADVRDAVFVWWIYPAYSHCFLIIPISAWLIWDRRDALFSDSPACTPAALLGAIPFVGLWFIGRFASITEFRQFAVVGLMEIFIIAILGWHIFRKIWFPSLYLFFLVPTGQYLIPPLQEITAKFVEVGLTFFSIPFFRDGLLFELVNGRYEIAEACAGLRFLVATVALGVLFAHLMYRRPLKIVAFLAACLVLPIIGNGIRALLTVMVANFTNNRVAAGMDHIVYGWVFAVAIIFTVMYVGAKFRDPEADIPPPAGAFRPPHYSILLATALGALAILSIGPAAGYFADRRPSMASQNALEALVRMPGWHRQEPAGDWLITFVPAPAHIAAALTRDGASAPPVDISISYYMRKRGAPSLLAATNHSWNEDSWHAIERHDTSRRLDGAEVPFKEAVIGYGNLKRLVWTTYWVDGRFTTSSLMLRLLEFESGVAHGHSAVLVFSTPITSSQAEARTRLGGALAAIPNLSAGLSKVGDLPAQTR